MELWEKSKTSVTTTSKKHCILDSFLNFQWNCKSPVDCRNLKNNDFRHIDEVYHESNWAIWMFQIMKFYIFLIHMTKELLFNANIHILKRLLVIISIFLEILGVLLPCYWWSNTLSKIHSNLDPAELSPNHPLPGFTMYQAIDQFIRSCEQFDCF